MLLQSATPAPATTGPQQSTSAASASASSHYRLPPSCTSSSSSPPLSARDEDLLSHWCDPIEQLKKHAIEKYSMNLWRVRQWADQPHIDQAICAMEAFMAKHARTAAIATLHNTTHVLNEVAQSDFAEPKDRRLAASQLHRTALRFLNLPPQPLRSPSGPPEGVPSLRGEGGMASPAINPAPSPQPSPQPPTPPHAHDESSNRGGGIL